MSKTQWDNEQIFELAEDVIITPVTNIRQDIRKQFVYENTDFVVTRPKGRAHSLVIDKEIAEFFEAFKKPVTLKQAAQKFSHERNMDVNTFLRDIDEAVKRMVIAGFLIEPGLKSKTGYNFLPGEIVDNAEVLNGHIILDETEVYCCKSPLGQPLALKIAKHQHDEKTNTLMEREYGVLSAGPHPVTPNPHSKGNYQGRAYLIMDWIEGQDILLTANHIRKSSKGAYPFGELKALVVKLLNAYEILHRSGIVHGDIHPKNCLIHPRGSVHIIDFGLSMNLATEGVNPAPERRGVPYFYDPDYASAFLDKIKPSPASIASDLYGLAALSYLLLTGYHYLPFRLERNFFFQQIKSEPLRSFQSVGIPGWPAAETALAKALSKNENERFVSAHAFSEALSAAEILIKTGNPSKKDDPAEARTSIARFQREGLDFNRPLSAPTASIHFGAAGIAYTLLKCAEQSGDAEIFSDADIWITRAKIEKAPKAYLDETMGITEKVAIPSSLHYGRLGVCICEAMIAFARWDCAVVNAAIMEICDLALKAPVDFDLMSGKAGVLLGCALLLEVVPDDPFLSSKQSLIDAGQLIALDLIEKLRPVGQITNNKTIMHLGIAHGWAGILYALMRWGEVVQVLPGILVKQYVQELADLSIPARPGRRWPIRLDSPTNAVDRFSASWCKGSSGFVHLFAQAFETYGDPHFLDTAIASADHAFSMPSNGATLCCGDAGLAYAQLAMFRITKEYIFSERARSLVTRACNSQLKSGGCLYKGRLGIHLLALGLTTPQEARMPFFERSGWPVMLTKNSIRIIQSGHHT